MEYRTILILEIFNLNRSKSVTWSIDEQCFYCYIEDQESDDDDWIDMDSLVKDAKHYGWDGFNKVMEI
jgi:hypothetical protein